MLRLYKDENGTWQANTEGKCANCGEWVDERQIYYGQPFCLACIKCYEDEEGE